MNLEEIISKIPINKANLEYIASTGKINGSLFISIKQAMEEYHEYASQFRQPKRLSNENYIPSQLCPKCHGEGFMKLTGTSSATTNICDVCGGNKIILMTQQPIDFIHGTDLVAVKELLDRGYQMAVNEFNSRPTPLSDEDIEKMADKYADEIYEATNPDENIQWQNRKDNFREGFKAALSLNGGYSESDVRKAFENGSYYQSNGTTAEMNMTTDEYINSLKK